MFILQYQVEKRALEGNIDANTAANVAQNEAAKPTAAAARRTKLAGRGMLLGKGEYMFIYI